MATPLQFPEIPPAGPWEGYVLVVIWLPMLLRLLFLVIPFRKAIAQLAPHSGWAWKQLRELPVKGFGILALNEILAFSIPPLLVLVVRMTSDPLGWQSWGEVSNTGYAFLMLFLIVWIFFDLLRISRVRRMMKAVEKRDISKLRKVAYAGIGIRKWLNKFSGKAKKTEEENEQSVTESGKNIAKNSLALWGTRILATRRLTPQGLLSGIAFGAAIEVAKVGAGKLTDSVDKKMQKEFDKIAWRFLLSMHVGEEADRPDEAEDSRKSFCFGGLCFGDHGILRSGVSGSVRGVLSAGGSAERGAVFGSRARGRQPPLAVGSLGRAPPTWKKTCTLPAESLEFRGSIGDHFGRGEMQSG